jgi:hypothetical protein
VYAGGKLVDEAAIGKELRARYAAG